MRTLQIRGPMPNSCHSVKFLGRHKVSFCCTQERAAPKLDFSQHVLEDLRGFQGLDGLVVWTSEKFNVLIKTNLHAFVCFRFILYAGSGSDYFGGGQVAHKPRTR
jgi:hypothetical protein